MNGFDIDPSIVRNILMFRSFDPAKRPDAGWWVCRTSSLTAFSKGYKYAVYDPAFDWPMTYLTDGEAELCFGWSLLVLLDMDSFARAKRPWYKTSRGNLRGVTVIEALAEWDKVNKPKPQDPQEPKDPQINPPAGEQG
jgi:hypothetical protein